MERFELGTKLGAARLGWAFKAKDKTTGAEFLLKQIPVLQLQNNLPPHILLKIRSLPIKTSLPENKPYCCFPIPAGDAKSLGLMPTDEPCLIVAAPGNVTQASQFLRTLDTPLLVWTPLTLEEFAFTLGLFPKVDVELPPPSNSSLGSADDEDEVAKQKLRQSRLKNPASVVSKPADKGVSFGMPKMATTSTAIPPVASPASSSPPPAASAPSTGPIVAVSKPPTGSKYKSADDGYVSDEERKFNSVAKIGKDYSITDNEYSTLSREDSHYDRDDSHYDRDDSQYDREDSQYDREDSQFDRDESYYDHSGSESDDYSDEEKQDRDRTAKEERPAASADQADAPTQQPAATAAPASSLADELRATEEEHPDVPPVAEASVPVAAPAASDAPAPAADAPRQSGALEEPPSPTSTVIMRKSEQSLGAPSGSDIPAASPAPPTGADGQPVVAPNAAALAAEAVIAETLEKSKQAMLDKEERRRSRTRRFEQPTASYRAKSASRDTDNILPDKLVRRPSETGRRKHRSSRNRSSHHASAEDEARRQRRRERRAQREKERAQGIYSGAVVSTAAGASISEDEHEKERTAEARLEAKKRTSRSASVHASRRESGTSRSSSRANLTAADNVSEAPSDAALSQTASRHHMQQLEGIRLAAARQQKMAAEERAKGMLEEFEKLRLAREHEEQQRAQEDRRRREEERRAKQAELERARLEAQRAAEERKKEEEEFRKQYEAEAAEREARAAKAKQARLDLIKQRRHDAEERIAHHANADKVIDADQPSYMKPTISKRLKEDEEAAVIAEKALSHNRQNSRHMSLSVEDEMMLAGMVSSPRSNHLNRVASEKKLVKEKVTTPRTIEHSASYSGHERKSSNYSDTSDTDRDSVRRQKARETLEQSRQKRKSMSELRSRGSASDIALSGDDEAPSDHSHPQAVTQSGHANSPRKKTTTTPRGNRRQSGLDAAIVGAQAKKQAGLEAREKEAEAEAARTEAEIIARREKLEQERLAAVAKKKAETDERIRRAQARRQSLEAEQAARKGYDAMGLSLSRSNIQLTSTGNIPVEALPLTEENLTKLVGAPDSNRYQEY